MDDAIIRFEGVTFSYAGTDEAPPALRDVDLEIGQGEYVAVLGLNGAGKTTLGLCLNGVVPTMLTGEMLGTVTVAGLDVSEYPVRELARTVGIVFDNPEFQMSQITVADEVALGLESAGVPYERMREIIPATLELVGLGGFEDRSPLGLSGGQQQRLAIAAVLAMEPQILVMDEPTSNLDPVGKQEVFDIAASLNRERGMTVLVFEHEVEVMAQYADRVIVLDKGRVVMNGTPADVLSRVDELSALNLRPPQSASLGHLLDTAHGLWSGSYPVHTETAAAAVTDILGARR